MRRGGAEEPAPACPAPRVSRWLSGELGCLASHPEDAVLWGSRQLWSGAPCPCVQKAGARKGHGGQWANGPLGLGMSPCSVGKTRVQLAHTCGHAQPAAHTALAECTCPSGLCDWAVPPVCEMGVP